MNRRGFTVVELLIVITVMGILLILGVVNLRGTQVSARDTERKTDIETIGLQLEIFYKSGTDNSTVIGRYPSTALVENTASIQENLRDADLKSFIPPGANSADDGFVMSANSIQTTGGVLPQPTTSTYVYQPLQQNSGVWSLCSLSSDACSKFNLFYKLEIATTDCPAPYNICMLTSKNQ